VVLLLLRRKRNDAYVSTPEGMPSNFPEVVMSPGNGVSQHENMVRSELGAGNARYYAHELGAGRSGNVAAELHAQDDPNIVLILSYSIIFELMIIRNNINTNGQT
jgi:hypothetical protein